MEPFRGQGIFGHELLNARRADYDVRAGKRDSSRDQDKREGKSCGTKGPAERPPTQRKQRQDPGRVGGRHADSPKSSRGVVGRRNADEARRHSRGGAGELERPSGAEAGFGKGLDDLLRQLAGEAALQERRGAERREAETRRGGSGPAPVRRRPPATGYDDGLRHREVDRQLDGREVMACRRRPPGDARTMSASERCSGCSGGTRRPSQVASPHARDLSVRRGLLEGLDARLTSRARKVAASTAVRCDSMLCR